jgi:para-aminobenzoate synthetase/4-amino-4-deoxychorismate lyase
MSSLPLTALREGAFVMRSGEQWVYFESSTAILIAHNIGEVADVYAKVESHLAAGGYAAGAIRFDAAPAFDPAFQVQDSGVGWLAIFHLFDREPKLFDRLESPPLSARVPRLDAALSEESYGEMFSLVHSALAAGQTYQVNATFPLLGLPAHNPAALFSLLCGEAPPPYAAYLESLSGPILSLSPELFFAKSGDSVTSRPMKGTRRRDESPEELRANPKDQAENLMIVDMIRNDLGRIAHTGTVRVPKLFEIEPHGTVWQMTSTVEAQTNAGLFEIFQALFPCASVVGAPKVETMMIIADIESEPRGIYTGAIGFVGPEQAIFNVAIRTLELREDKTIYGVGSGLVWDSTPKEEWRECFAKAEILKPYGDELGLIETMRWDPQKGFYFLDLHLDRLARSAAALDIDLNIPAIERALNTTLARQGEPTRVRLEVAKSIRVSIGPLEAPFRSEPLDDPIPVALSRIPIDSQNPWLRHKTTFRRPYDLALAAAPNEAEDVVLRNEKDEITEFTIGNVVVDLDGRLVTPPLDSGLLPGVYRRILLESGEIEEAVIQMRDLPYAKAVYRINSVRGWQPVAITEA